MPYDRELVTSKPVRLVIAEGHEIVLLGLERFLSSLEDFAVVATATDCSGSLAAIRAHRPDVAILDTRLPSESGLEVAAAILREGLSTRIVLVGGPHSWPNLVVRFQRARGKFWLNGRSALSPSRQRHRHPSIGSRVWCVRRSTDACRNAIRSGAVPFDTSGRVRADSIGRVSCRCCAGGS
jgi:Response regulator receiver domain